MRLSVLSLHSLRRTLAGQRHPTGRLGSAASKEISVDKKSSSNAKVSANRLNARKSTGPSNTSSTRLNATKHGLLSAGITELDDADGYRDTLHRLGEAYLEELETFLLGRIALYMVRLQRTPRLEAELITSILHPPTYGEDPLAMPSFPPPLIDPGLPARIESEGFEALARYERYEAATENKLYRAMNQLERIRRIRQGEQLPAPAVLDVGVHSESPGGDSAGAVPNLVLESSQVESAHKGRKVRTEGASANDPTEKHTHEVNESTTEEPD
jgi:hypothetical protein